jgi:hypothetical protein
VNRSGRLRQRRRPDPGLDGRCRLLHRGELRAAAARGDYRWNSGKGRFNLGLFRGLAGVGYTALRRLDGSLPNVVIWE